MNGKTSSYFEILSKMGMGSVEDMAGNKPDEEQRTLKINKLEITIAICQWVTRLLLVYRTCLKTTTKQLI